MGCVISSPRRRGRCIEIGQRKLAGGGREGRVAQRARKKNDLLDLARSSWREGDKVRKRRKLACLQNLSRSRGEEESFTADGLGVAAMSASTSERSPQPWALQLCLSALLLGASVFAAHRAYSTPLADGPTRSQVWWFGWVTMLSTGLGALPMLFVKGESEP
eukprot:scaffold186692_cov43-Tisochrysis_lutea.AAC.4